MKKKETRNHMYQRLGLMTLCGKVIHELPGCQVKGNVYVCKESMLR